nr:diguanylate cyclase [Lachnospiraceae bacterium]
MKHWIHRMNGYLSGTLTIDNSFKYSFICYVAATIHMVITVTFFYLNITPVYYYNVLSTIFYLYMATVLVRKEKYIWIFMATITEVLFHSIFFSILMGWHWGYMTYVMALIPIAFYLSLTLPQIRRHILSPILTGIFVCICFVITRLICDNTTPMYTNVASKEFITISFCVNSATAFAITIFFSVMFSIEIRQMQRNLMHENETLDKIASHDPLTKLLNRRSMEVHLNHVMDTAKKTGAQFSLIMADIDDFKKVNDNYGHDVGDQVLIHVAN